MAQTWGSTFKNSPAGGDAPSTLDNQQRVHREAVEERMENEHDTFEDSTAGLASADWRHKEGSARAYYQSAAPTTQPGSAGATLGASDDGRLWWDSDDDELRCWDGSAMQTIKKVSGALEVAGGIDAGVGINLKTKLLTYTMAGETTLNIAHGLTYTDIRAIAPTLVQTAGAQYIEGHKVKSDGTIFVAFSGATSLATLYILIWYV